MEYVHYTKINIKDRMRKKIDPEDLATLKRSILAPAGLLHAPIGWFDRKNEQWTLIAGERRFRALIALFKEGHTIFYDSRPVPFEHIPLVTILEELDEASRLEAELNENEARVALSWMERDLALKKIHDIQLKINPSQTWTQTAKDVLASSPTGKVSGVQNVEVMRRKVTQAVRVAEAMEKGTPEVQKLVAASKSSEEAYNKIRRMEEEKWQAALIKNKRKSVPEKPPVDIRCGDLVEMLPDMEDSSFDLILADPPYGIDIGSAGLRSRTSEHHNYDDSPEYAKTIIGAILSEGFRLTKERGNLIIFCNWKMFDWIHENSSRCGWTPWVGGPIIWQKSKSEGLAPWGRRGFRRTYEMIFWATKGQKGLHHSPTDVLEFPRVPKGERIYGAQKPLDLMKFLIESSTIEGDRILDPCCGSGMTLLAARLLRRYGIGIEKDPSVVDKALVNVNQEPEKEEVMDDVEENEEDDPDEDIAL